jgi:membrane protein DedA with SNARE-associated domain
MSLETLISEYGYYAIAIGTFLEGETILVLGGFAAHRGYLELPWVITSAFVGALSGDQLYYYIGRTRGRRMLDTRPKWKAKSERVLALLHKHQVLLILGFRFLYGIRTVTPFLIGASKVSPVRFLVLNIIGAAIWAIAIGGLGYLFGHTLDSFLGDAKKYELIVLVLLVLIAAIIRLIQSRKNTPTN